MFEGLALILAGVAGYVGWPWWWAAILGAIAGASHASRRFFAGPWRMQLEQSGVVRSRAIGALLIVVLWTSAGCAVLFTAIWFVVRWVSGLLA